MNQSILTCNQGPAGETNGAVVKIAAHFNGLRSTPTFIEFIKYYVFQIRIKLRCMQFWIGNSSKINEL